MMRDSLLPGLFACLVLSANLHAQTPPDAGKAAQPRAAPVDPSASSVERQPQRRSRPDATFNPSEKIRADSAVSFPVDI